jgi:LmbE family N-acetylglucosaminyl deacetylase
MDATRIRQALDRLDVVGSALMIAAHPDDENTALLAWLANGRKVRTAYLSVTRGDGGQNLIGGESGVALGLIRTQELLAARRLDGAEQMFTSALDFGYSKNTEETLTFWEEGADPGPTWCARFRTFQPDVIVTRFTPKLGGHGHHTASAVLAEEAFAAAADPARFPEQKLPPWRAKRLVWNAFRFGGAGPDTTPGRIQVDLGVYDPLLGRSYAELAGESRSMHKSQGFGAPERRGAWVNALEVRLGDPATKDLFEGVDLTWKRVPGGAAVTQALADARKAWDPAAPHLMLPALARARHALGTLADIPIVRQKRVEIDELMRGCAGLWLEAIAESPTVLAGLERPDRDRRDPPLAGRGRARSCGDPPRGDGADRHADAGLQRAGHGHVQGGGAEVAQSVPALLVALGATGGIFPARQRGRGAAPRERAGVSPRGSACRSRASGSPSTCRSPIAGPIACRVSATATS